MHCQHCGTQTQEGVAFCQNCGSPISPPPQSLPPTIAAPQPSYTIYNPPPHDPLSNPYGSTPNPYENPPSSYPPPPANFPPYPQPNNTPAYVTPPAYGANVAAPGYGTSTPVKPKSKVGLIIGIVIAMIIVGIIGAGILAGLSPSSKPGSSSPSGTAVDSTAASIITNLQMASSINKDTAKPTKLTTSFTADSYIYATYQYDFKSIDLSTTHPTYMEAKWYKSHTLLRTSKILDFDGTDDEGGTKGYAYFGLQYSDPATTGAVEIYLCWQSNCSDAKLARYTTFTVK